MKHQYDQKTTDELVAILAQRDEVEWSPQDFQEIARILKVRELEAMKTPCLISEASRAKFVGTEVWKVEVFEKKVRLTSQDSSSQILLPDDVKNVLLGETRLGSAVFMFHVGKKRYNFSLSENAVDMVRKALRPKKWVAFGDTPVADPRAVLGVSKRIDKYENVLVTEITKTKYNTDSTGQQPIMTVGNDIAWLLGVAKRESGALWSFLMGLGLLAGFMFIIRNSGSGEELYLFGLIPLSWVMLAGGIAGIGKGVLLVFHKPSVLGISEDGLYTSSTLITWEEIDRVYVGGATMYFQFLIKASETGHFKVVSTKGDQFVVDAELGGVHSKRRKAAFSALMDAVLSRVSKRHWDDFRACMKSGECTVFSDILRVDSDGIHIFAPRNTLVPFTAIQSYSIDDGQLFVCYLDDRGKKRTHSLGQVESTANMHVLRALLQTVSDANMATHHPRPSHSDSKLSHHDRPE